jgi:hypothetical protein
VLLPQVLRVADSSLSHCRLASSALRIPITYWPRSRHVLSAVSADPAIDPSSFLVKVCMVRQRRQWHRSCHRTSQFLLRTAGSSKFSTGEAAVRVCQFSYLRLQRAREVGLVLRLPIGDCKEAHNTNLSGQVHPYFPLYRMVRTIIPLVSGDIYLPAERNIA